MNTTATTPEPLAIRLADILQAGENFYGESTLWFDSNLADAAGDAADELRRLAAVEAERDQLRAEVAALRADSFESVIQHLAATIPDDGSSITIHIEHWAGSVTATDWDGNEMPERDSDTVLDRVRSASRWLDDRQSTLKQGSAA